MKKITLLLVLVGLITGCASTRNVGIISKSTADPGSLITASRSYKQLGAARAEACRYFLLGIIPWGDSTVATAMDKALAENGGDALINVSVTTSLYGFVPIYNVFSFTCTTVEGIAIKYEAPEGSK
jgi:hypothetical protein